MQRWGQPRLTRDADLTLLVEFGTEDAFIDALLDQFVSRVPDARVFARATRVLLLHAVNRVALDVALGATPFEERSIQRASWYPISPRRKLLTCSAEDLIVHKAFANRPQDWIDIEGIIIRQGDRLDIPLIWEELTPLVELKEEPEIIARLQQQFEQR